MAFNSSIPLSGRGPNVMARIADATRTAAGINEVQRQNRLAQIQQDHGAGILSGDRSALNALAGVDVQGAMAIQTQQQNMRIQRERLSMARQAAARAAANQAAQMDAAQAAAEAAQLERAIAGAMGAESQEQLDGFLRTVAPDLVGAVTMQNREMYAAQALGVKDAIELARGPEPADEYGRYTQEEMAAGRQPLSRIDYAQAKKGQETIYGPDGQVIVQRGPAKLPKTTEGEKSASGYLSRMRAAEKTLSNLSEDGPAVRSITSLLVAGTNFEGVVLDERQERILQAQRDWVRAKLRKESGAVIGEEEMAEEVRTYFPLPMEGPETVEQKRQARRQAERQFEIMSGNAAPQAKQPQAQPVTFEDFAADPSAIAAAEMYGVTLEEMWAIKQGQQ